LRMPKYAARAWMCRGAIVGRSSQRQGASHTPTHNPAARSPQPRHTPTPTPSARSTQTYAERLWCVVELFTFLSMGGSLERVDLLPLGDGTRADVEERFQSFAAQDAVRALTPSRHCLVSLTKLHTVLRCAATKTTTTTCAELSRPHGGTSIRSTTWCAMFSSCEAALPAPSEQHVP
jgi:hypothetical protein